MIKFRFNKNNYYHTIYSSTSPSLSSTTPDSIPEIFLNSSSTPLFCKNITIKYPQIVPKKKNMQHNIITFFLLTPI